MKHKLNKWHIALMSFFALFIAVFASLFNLKADTVDDETGEVLTDNWKIDLVFYDSTVDAGTTPLTEINWDASNNSYGTGTSRTITVQITYENNNAVTTYQPGEVLIEIPNLAYYNPTQNSTGSIRDAQITATVIAGANDETHTGYDWEFVPLTDFYQSPNTSQEVYRFLNTKTINENSNFEGSIRIQYTLTPGSDSPEGYIDECIHEYIKNLQAKLYCRELVAQSENFPEPLPYPETGAKYYTYEYSIPEGKSMLLDFDDLTDITIANYLKIYDKDDNLLMTISNSYNKNFYIINQDYIKVTFTHGHWGTLFRITNFVEKTISNEINFNYTRTYVHPWTKPTFTLSKTATKLTSLDVPYHACTNSEDYIWVQYNLIVDNYRKSGYTYPQIRPEYYSFEDTFPEECIVADINGNLLTSENNKYTITRTEPNNKTFPNNSGTLALFVGYPKSTYNEEIGNLNITNTAYLSIAYADDPNNFIYQDDGSVSLNLADFKFEYSGNLYGIRKSLSSLPSYEALTGQDANLSSIGYSYIYIEAKYTGTPMDIKFGDDLLYITDANGNYRKITEQEYYFQEIYMPGYFSSPAGTVPKNEYEFELWVKGNTEEILNNTITFNNRDSMTVLSTNKEQNDNYIKIFTGKNIAETRSSSTTSSWTLPENLNVTSYYFIFKDVDVSISSSSQTSKIKFHNMSNIAEEGTIYNFSYLQVFNDEILLNEQTIDNYANFITKEEIASFDIENYSTYIQRATNNKTYKKYQIATDSYTFYAQKIMDKNIIQDAENEVFKGTAYLGLQARMDDLSSWTAHEIKNYLPEEYMLAGFEFFDLLPAGMTLTSTAEEIKNNITYFIDSNVDLWDANSFNYYTKNGSISYYNMNPYYRKSATVEITENWQGTGRTHIHIIMDFSNEPIVIKGNSSYSSSQGTIFYIPYNYEVSYDSYLEYGSIWNNTVYIDYYQRSDENIFSGKYYADELDINNNGINSDKMMRANASASITSIVSTHQDVTTYVKTNYNNFTTTTANSSINTNYQYKLRVRTGASDVTNLILYTNIEEAQPERTRWKGEFLGIDTSFARSKGYNVKTYYSENPKAGNLYNENGTLNSDWLEYHEESREAGFVGGNLAITFNNQCQTESVNFDYIDIFYKKDDTIYKLGRWGGTDLAGKTIIVPSGDFWLYWRTDGSVSSYYGFSIDSISPTDETVNEGTVSSLPNYTVEEITGNSYPDSAFGTYIHGNYGNNINKIWHYTYDGPLGGYQEAITATDKTKVKSLAFEYLDHKGNPAILPTNSLTYVLIDMKSPNDETLTTLARMDCRTQWNAIDEFDRPVDFITGINSNVVKVALPMSVDEDNTPFISLKFTKEITGTDAQFENILLNKNNAQTFMIRLTSLIANEDNTYNQITALLKSDQELIISQIPVGTYLLEELGDNYFNFVEFTENNGEDIIINGVTFERIDQGYVLTVSEELTENIEFNIKVTNEIEDERFYEYKDNKENLFLKNKIESEDA